MWGGFWRYTAFWMKAYAEDMKDDASSHKNIIFEEMGGKLKRKKAYYKIYHVAKISVCFHNLSLSFASINELYSSRY